MKSQEQQVRLPCFSTLVVVWKSLVLESIDPNLCNLYAVPSWTELLWNHSFASYFPSASFEINSKYTSKWCASLIVPSKFAALVPYVTAVNKTAGNTNIYVQYTTVLCSLKGIRIMFEHSPIDWAFFSICAIQTLQKIGVITLYGLNNIRSLP